MDEERGHELVAWPTALRRVEAPGFLKQTYGVRRCLAYNDSCLEPTPGECAELDQRLDRLRAVVPNSTRRRGRNDSIILDAYHYIAKLQKQVEDLSSELLKDGALAQTYNEETEARSLPTVLEVRIVCRKRPGLLADVMAAVESRGLVITHTKVACHSDIVFQHLSLESEESVSDEDGDEEVGVDSVKAMLINIIGDSDRQ